MPRRAPATRPLRDNPADRKFPTPPLPPVLRETPISAMQLLPFQLLRPFLWILVGALPALSPASTLSISGTAFVLDGNRFDMWGIRTASASQTPESTASLIANLDAYRAHGVNTVSLYYMGSSAAYSDPFSPDGTSIAADHQGRMDQLIDACNARDMVVIVGIFYQRSDHPQLRDWDAAKAAVRTVTHALRRHSNIIINIANEQNSSRYEQMPWKRVRQVDGVLELCRIVKEVHPERLVGAGGYQHDNNREIGLAAEIDTLLFDTNGPESSGDLYRRFRAAGIDKPIVNIETFGAWTAKFKPQGVFNAEIRNAYLSEIAHAAREDGLYLHFHNNPWIQAAPPETVRYELGGQGTAEDPGIRWYFEAVKAAAGRAMK